MVPFSFGENGKPLESGESSTVTCSVSAGDLPLELSWWFNGEKIAADRTDITIILAKKSAILTVDSASWEHAGNYTCLARNPAGVATYTTELVVYG